jgi:uncharacterized protein
MDTMDRRRFIKNSFMGASLLAASPLAALSQDAAPSRDEKPRLITRRLGKTGIELPIVSFGVMRADNPGLVKAALAAGIKHVDTAHGYQHGNNETMLGEVLKDYPRDSYVISTKVPPNDNATFMADFELSLKRLKLDYVDILYVHGVSSEAEVLSQTTLETVRAIKASGKARHIGVSTHKNEPDVIRAAVKSGFYEVVLTSINFRQNHYAEVKKAIAEAAEAGLGIVAMKTMAGGFHDKERTKPINCVAALKWVLQDPNVTTSIPGVTTFDMLNENAGVNYDLAMTETEKSSLAPGKAEGGLYCPGCSHCSGQCAKNLPVPDLMRAYMYAYGYRDAGMAQDVVRAAGVGGNPCGDCGSCTVDCPKKFDLPGRIGDIARLASVPREFIA